VATPVLTISRQIIGDDTGLAGWFLAGSVIMIVFGVLGVIALSYKCLLLLAIPILGYISFRRKHDPFFLYILSLPFLLYIMPANRTLVNYGFLLLVMALWVIRSMIMPTERIVISKQLILFAAAFMAAVLISDLNHSITIEELKSLMRVSIFFCAILALYDIIEARRYIVLIFLLSIPMFLSSLLLIKVYSSAGGLLGFVRLFRLKPAGFYENSNGLGLAIMSVLPIWISIVIWIRRGWTRRVSIFMTVVLSIGLILTNSRGAMFGLGISSLFLAYWAKKLRYYLVLILAAIVIFFSFPIFGALTSAAFRLDRGVSTRDQIWRNTIEIIEHNWVLGVGLGNFTEAYDPSFGTAAQRAFFGGVQHAHNFVLSKTAELGIAGFMLSLILYYLPIKKSLVATRKMINSKDRAITYGIIGGIIAIFARSIFEGSGIIAVGRIYPDIIFWVLFVMILKLADFYPAGEQSLFFEKRRSGTG
jgi:O-antigen ligase